MTHDNNPNRPLHEQIPPPVVGSPVRVLGDGEMKWYLPGFGERLRLMGWRVIYFFPAVLLIALLIFIWTGLHSGWASGQLILVWWKLVVITIALPMGAAVKAAGQSLRNRSDPFCIHCGYSLEGLPENYICPECGQPYTRAEINEYKQDPHWFISRHTSAKTIPHGESTSFSAGDRRAANQDGTE